MNRLAFVFAITVTLALTGCFGARQAVPITHYTIDPQFTVPDYPEIGKTLGIRALLIARPYERLFAYLDDENVIEFRTQSQWAERPETVVTRAVQDAIIETGRFADAGDAVNMARPDLILTGEIRKFYEDRTTNPHKAVVQARFELREARGEKNFYDATLTSRAEVYEDSAAGVADAMTRAVGEMAKVVATGIAEAVAS